MLPKTRSGKIMRACLEGGDPRPRPGDITTIEDEARSKKRAPPGLN
jgi:hypothetical protein